MSSHAVYLREWRQWRTHTDARCEAAVMGRQNGRRGKRCLFAGAWNGQAGRVLCRVHSDLYARATGEFRFVR